MDYIEPPTDDLNPIFSDWPFLLGLALMGAVLFFYHLGVPGLMDPDEGRYAEIAREFFISHDWLIPHLNLFPYLEKPPLVYWLTALSFGGLGYTEFAARLPSALSALAGMFLAYGLGRAFWGPAPAFLGATVLATCAGYVTLARLLTLDMALAFFLNLGVGLGYLALSRERPRLWLWAYGALALAVLIKGPVALVLAGLIWLGGVALARRSWRELVQPRGWLLLAVIVLPWFAAVQWRYPEFFRFFVLEQHLGRFLTPAIHPEPFYYYVPVIFGLALPWSWLLPWALVSGPTPRDADRTFLLLWAAVVLVFFSLSRGKLAPYILPALLPLALVLGRGLAGCFLGPGAWQWGGRFLRLSLLAWGVTGCVLVALYFWPPVSLAQALLKANLFSPYLLITLSVLALTPLLALIWRQVAVLFLGALLLSALLPVGMEKLSVRRSPRELGLALQSQWRAGDALAGVGLYSQGLSFYSGQIFHLLGCRTELDFGQKLEPRTGLCLADAAALTGLLAAHPRIFLYIKEQDLPGWREQLPGKMSPLAAQKDCVLWAYEGK